MCPEPTGQWLYYTSPHRACGLNPSIAPAVGLQLCFQTPRKEGAFLNREVAVSPAEGIGSRNRGTGGPPNGSFLPIPSRSPSSSWGGVPGSEGARKARLAEISHRPRSNPRPGTSPPKRTPHTLLIGSQEDGVGPHPRNVPVHLGDLLRTWVRPSARPTPSSGIGGSTWAARNHSLWKTTACTD